MTEHNKAASQSGFLIKSAASLWALWGVLHIWVGGEGIRLYGLGVRAMWDMFIGGSRAPRAEFQYPTDAVTTNVHTHFILNFCFDVAGYGFLGLVVAWALWKRPLLRWPAYLLGLCLIGLCDLSFTFLQVTAGLIEQNIPTLSGPIIWAIACVLTPIALRRES